MTTVELHTDRIEPCTAHFLAVVLFGVLRHALLL